MKASPPVAASNSALVARRTAHPLAPVGHAWLLPDPESVVQAAQRRRSPPVPSAEDGHGRRHEGMRTIVASMATAATRATPICLMIRMSPAMNPAKTMMMSSAAEVMIRPVRCRPRKPPGRSAHLRGTPR